MGIGYSKNTNTGGSKPYYVDEGTVKDALIQPGQYNDIELILTIEKEKKDGTNFDKKLYFRGNFGKEGNKVVSWGKTAWKVENVLKVLDVKPNANGELVDEDGKFVGDIESLKGKGFFFISYIRKNTNGNISYSNWDTIDVDPVALEAKWTNRNPAYPKDYDPELIHIKNSPPPETVADAVSEEDPF